VVHRDLKPGNVMVGAFGEVQVMDWGLAKVLDPGRDCRAAGDPADPDPDPAAPVDLTQYGTILGTPAFMAPEQATGRTDRIDRRTDVFALGGLLAAVLTGRPPYTGDSAQSTHQLAVRADLGSCFARLDGCGAEPELVALARRCLTADPDGRPADATAVATAVADFRAAADERARRAEIDREKAEVATREQRKRRRVQLALGSAVLAAVLVGGAVAGWQWRSAVASQWATERALADLTDEQGRTKAALAQVTKQQQQLLDEKGNTLAALNAMTGEAIQKLFARQPQLGDAEKRFLQTVLVLHEKASAGQGDTPADRRLRADGLPRVASIRLSLGELGDAEREYLTARDLLTELVAAHPTDEALRDRLAAVRGNLGTVFRDTGRLKEAAVEFAAAREAYRRLADERPAAESYRWHQAAAANNQGIVLFDLGRTREAKAEYTSALALLRKLVDEFPDDLDYRRQMAVARHNLGLVYQTTKRLAEAEKEWGEALALRQKLADAPTAVPDDRRDLALTHGSLGLVYRDRRRPDAALKSFAAARGLIEGLAKEYPGVPRYREQLADVRANTGIVYGETDRPAEAEREYRAALALRQKLADEAPTVPRCRHELATVRQHLGTLYRDANDGAKAEAEYAAAYKLLEPLTRDHPQVSGFRSDFADLLRHMAGLHEAADRPREAEKLFARSRDLLIDLVAADPDDLRAVHDLALTRSKLGDLYFQANRMKETEAEYAAVRPLREKLAADPEAHPDVFNDLAGVLVNLGLVKRQTGDAAAARDLLAAALPHHRAALKADAANPGFRLFFFNNRLVTAMVLLGLADHAPMPGVIDELLEYAADRPAEVVRAAQFLSRCVPLAEADPKLTADERAKAADDYAERSLALVREAVAGRRITAAKLRGTRDFAPLRNREAFQKLIAELETPKREVLPAPRRQ
jgi:tetratricopeptide (TPR) repeat protein